jgi:hypothetical protein
MHVQSIHLAISVKLLMQKDKRIIEERGEKELGREMENEKSWFRNRNV